MKDLKCQDVLMAWAGEEGKKEAPIPAASLARLRFTVSGQGNGSTLVPSSLPITTAADFREKAVDL